MNYLVAYDIVEPKRLKRVAKALLRYGIRIEKSVFLCDLEPSKLPKLRHDLLALGEEDDTILIFQLQTKIKCITVCGTFQGAAGQEMY